MVRGALPAYKEGYFCGKLIREQPGTRWSRAAVYRVNGNAGKHRSGGASSLTHRGSCPVPSLLCHRAWPAGPAELSVVVMMDAQSSNLLFSPLEGRG